MNNQLRSKNADVNPTKSDLLHELGMETTTARRQELLKAIWRMDRGRAQPVSRHSARPGAVAAAASRAPLRKPQRAQELDRRPQAWAKSPPAKASRQEDFTRSPKPLNDKHTLAVLNQLYVLERFSMASYLRDAKPWVAAADKCKADVIRHIGDQQRAFSERVGALIIERSGHVIGDSFPMRFTAYNDLSVAYLAPRVLEDQERIVRQVAAIAHQLCADPVACELANEILAAEQTHRNDLRELLGVPRSEAAVAALGEPTCADTAASVATAA